MAFRKWPAHGISMATIKIDAATPLVSRFAFSPRRESHRITADQGKVYKVLRAKLGHQPLVCVGWMRQRVGVGSWRLVQKKRAHHPLSRCSRRGCVGRRKRRLPPGLPPDRRSCSLRDLQTLSVKRAYSECVSFNQSVGAT